MDLTAELPETEPATISDNHAVKPRLPHAFTSETAKRFSEMAIKAKRDRAEQAKRDREKLAEMLPRTDRLASQLIQIEELMDGETDADTLQKLSAAHARIFSAWQVLSGTPNPGARKAGRNAKPAPIQPEPIAEPKTPDKV